MSGTPKKQAGFTIVELLIVIVVIAILATISIVAYNGIQDRANNSAVQSDMTNLAKKIRIYEAENGGLPKGGSATGNSAAFPGVTFKVSKGAYATNGNNLSYCQGAKSGQQTFAIAARSKSLTTFVYTPESGFTQSGSGSVAGNCGAGWDGDVYSHSYGYYMVNDQWWNWTNG
jgi:prepilin-type N-terminal cleavage/methylation domain-containing protein